jgi:hypothetical protein
VRSPVVLVVLLAAAPSARAGRTPYGWLEDVEVLPERGVELESWIEERNGWRLGPTNTLGATTRVGWSATIGVTDRVELELPVEWAWDENVGTQLERWGGELRWRLACPDPVTAPPVVGLLRLRAARFASVRGVYRVEPGAVVSADLGRARLTADLGVAFDLHEDGDSTWMVRPGLGGSVRVHGDLRAGAELFAELGDGDEIDDWSAAGPNLGYTHGRTWLSAALLVGLADVSWAPRLNWGIAF